MLMRAQTTRAPYSHVHRMTVVQRRSSTAHTRCGRRGQTGVRSCPRGSTSSVRSPIQPLVFCPGSLLLSAMSLSDSYVVVATSADYVRVFTLYGTPFRVYRQKSTPTVTCASWRDYVLTMGNGAVGGDGSTRLLYTIENVRRDEVCQSEDTVALPQGTTLKSVFFSDKGVSFRGPRHIWTIRSQTWLVSGPSHLR